MAARKRRCPIPLPFVIPRSSNPISRRRKRASPRTAGASCEGILSAAETSRRPGPAVEGGRGEPAARRRHLHAGARPQPQQCAGLQPAGPGPAVPRPDPPSRWRWSWCARCWASFLISNFTANIARPGSRSMALHSDQALVMPGAVAASLGDEHHLVPDRRAVRERRDPVHARAAIAVRGAPSCRRCPLSRHGPSRPRPARSSRWRAASGTPPAPTSPRTRIAPCCSATTRAASCGRR